MSRQPLIVGLGGTARAASTSERALRVALDQAVRLGCATQVFGGPDLPKEFYSVETSERSAHARASRDVMSSRPYTPYPASRT